MNIPVDNAHGIEREDLKRFIHLLAAEENKHLWEKVDLPDLQMLIETVIQIYATRLEALHVSVGEIEPFMPLSDQMKLPQTEAMIFVNRVLECMSIELFELQMFKSFYR